MTARRCVIAALTEHFGPELAVKYEQKIYAQLKGDPEYNDSAFELVGRLAAAAQKKGAEAVRIEDILSEKPATTWDSSLYARETANIQKHNISNTYKPEVREGVLQCKLCGGKKTLYYQMQTRSADEGMTTFYTCAGCGNRWRG